MLCVTLPVASNATLEVSLAHMSETSGQSCVDYAHLCFVIHLADSVCMSSQDYDLLHPGTTAAADDNSEQLLVSVTQRVQALVWAVPYARCVGCTTGATDGVVRTVTKDRFGVPPALPDSPENQGGRR